MQTKATSSKIATSIGQFFEHARAHGYSAQSLSNFRRYLADFGPQGGRY